jgi:hypothetical protein
MTTRSKRQRRPGAKTVRRFVVWADIHHAEHIVEMPPGSSDKECEDACQEALDVLIGNGDTGWSELHDDGSES